MQKNTDILMEIVYFCMQIDLHVSYKYICAEISYIILTGGGTIKIFSTVNWKEKFGFHGVVAYIYLWDIKHRVPIMLQKIGKKHFKS